jgi:ribosomal protein S27AE
MDKTVCPKCGHAMDDGRLSSGHDSPVGYVSDKQTGMLRHATALSRTRACTECGYVELYLDPQQLKKRIG